MPLQGQPSTAQLCPHSAQPGCQRPLGCHLGPCMPFSQAQGDGQRGAPPSASLSPLHTDPHSAHHMHLRPGGSWGEGGRWWCQMELVTPPGSRRVLHILAVVPAWRSPSRLLSTLTGPNPQLTVNRTVGAAAPQIPDVSLTKELLSTQPTAIPPGRRQSHSPSPTLSRRPGAWAGHL